MRIWTVHTDRRDPPSPEAAPPPAARPPVLVQERFTWLAFLLPLPWLLWHRLWPAALLFTLIALALGMLLPPGLDLIAVLALQLLVGLHAQDLRRRDLARRGYRLTAVVAAPDQDAALLRLLDRDPTLLAASPGRAVLA